MNPIERFLKAFRMEWNVGNRWSWYSTGRTRFDYRSEIGDGRTNSIVQACVLWFCRNFPEAPIRVSRLDSSGDPTPLPNHPLKLLLDTPNPFYSGELLWFGTLADWCFGNAYWLKIRSGAGRPIQLWWTPSSMMEPRWPEDGSQFISHYDYTPNGEVIRIPREDVVHFRYGLDPRNPRKGLSPLGSLLREIYTDEEASNYSATMLRNVGVPPVVISPGPNVKPTQDELDEIKQGYMAKTVGDRRGEPMVMRGETNIEVLGFNPAQMNLRDMRGIPEERISAIFGIPAAVVGLGSGLSNSKVGATMSEFREQAYENMVIPSQRLLAGELRTQLLPDFGTSSTLRLDFDLTQVRVLQEDQNSRHERARGNLMGGLWTLNRALEEVGDEPLPDGDVLYIPSTITPTDPAELLTPPEPVMTTVTELPAANADEQEQRALPPAKQFKIVMGRKSASQENDVERLRDRLEPAATSDLTRFLEGQKNRVLARFQGTKAEGGPTADELMEGEQEKLAEALAIAVLLRSLVGMHALAQDWLQVAFDLDVTARADFLRLAGRNIQGIDRTTREAIRGALRAGAENNESIGQIASRIESLGEFSPARAQLIARTEVAQATNSAALFTYRASGRVVGIRVTDGDFDDPCKAMQGRIFRIEDAPAPLEHPNCRRQFHPITDPAELGAVA